MTADKPFNLTALVRAVLSESLESDPHLLAKEVAKRIKKGDLGEALRQALPSIVRQEFGRHQAATYVPTDPSGDAHGSRDAHGARGVAGGPNRSRKVSAIREHWRDVLVQRIAVAPDTYKMISECGVADLEAAAATREEHAKRTLARAEQLRMLAGLLGEYGAATVGELPDAILRPALTAEAA